MGTQVALLCLGYRLYVVTQAHFFGGAKLIFIFLIDIEMDSGLVESIEICL